MKKIKKIEAPKVKTIELNKDCKACMAAKRIIEMQQKTISNALKKIRLMDKKMKQDHSDLMNIYELCK